jgi:hypothetical protein
MTSLKPVTKALRDDECALNVITIIIEVDVR